MFGRLPLIQLRRVVKSYQAGAGQVMALRGVDLRVEAGEFLAVTGRSGSGKSTLIRILSGLDRPTAGEVVAGETAVHLLSEQRLAAWRGRTVGLVLPRPVLLPDLTVLENLLLPMEFAGVVPASQRRVRALELLSLAGLEEVGDSRPALLSDGQQQLVSVVRALANDPPVLLADEPGCRLDSASAEAVYRLLELVAARGRTVIVATLDADLARRAPRILTLADGRVVDDDIAYRKRSGVREACHD